jgi:hypothetical protein
MSAIAGSVAVGLIRPHLQQTKSSVEFITATDMPTLPKLTVRAAIRRCPVWFLYVLEGFTVPDGAAGGAPSSIRASPGG